MTVSNVLGGILAAILMENFVAVRMLGTEALVKGNRSLTTAITVGLVVGVDVLLAAILFWPLDSWILSPLHLDYLRTFTSVLATAVLARVTVIVVARYLPRVAKRLEGYTSLAVMNSAVLGAAIFSAESAGALGGAILWGLGAGLGFLLANLLITSIQIRLEFSTCPKAFQGFPIAMVALGLLALAFGGFVGLSV